MNLDRNKAIDGLLDAVAKEVVTAQENYPAFNTAHEGYAVLLEEVDELWAEVKVKQGRRDVLNMRKECVQIASMALRFAFDICDNGRGQK